MPGTTGHLNFPESGNRCLRVHLPWCNGALDGDSFLCRAPTYLHEIQFFYWPPLHQHPPNAPTPKHFFQTPSFKHTLQTGTFQPLPSKRLITKHCLLFTSAFSCPLTAVFDKLRRAPFMGITKREKTISEAASADRALQSRNMDERVGNPLHL